MAIGLELEVVADVLHARLSGDFALADAERSFLDVLAAAYERRLARVLVDARALRGRPTLEERFRYAEFAARAVTTMAATRSPLPLRFAYVMTSLMIDPDRIGETIATHRGMEVRAFEELSQALAWLGPTPGQP